MDCYLRVCEGITWQTLSLDIIPQPSLIDVYLLKHHQCGLRNLKRNDMWMLVARDTLEGV